MNNDITTGAGPCHYVRGLDPSRKYPTFNGIMPLVIKDGTRVVVLPDIHSPAHDKALMWAILLFLTVYKPDIIIFIGDLADVFALGRHDKALRSVCNAHEEIMQTRELFDQIMAASGAQHAYIIMGNHEYRIPRFLVANAPQLGGVIDPHSREPFSFHAWMGFKPGDPVTVIYGVDESGGFEGGVLVNDDLMFHHGYIVRPHAAASPLADMDRWMRSVAHGHTHRFGVVARATMKDVLRGYELGSLIDPNHAYFAYAHRQWSNWHPGFGVGQVHNGKMLLEAIPIVPMRDDKGIERLSFEYQDRIYRAATR